MNFKRKSLLSLAAIASLSILHADETKKVADVTVISTAFDAQVKQISAQQLEETQASDIKDILKSLPSVMVDGNARYGQKVFVRGLEDKFANITIDGAKMSGQLFHHAGDQTIDASLLKVSSVELGPNSAISGPGVINGSFKYETKDPSDFLEDDETFGGKVSLGYETARERKKGSVAVFAKANEYVEFVGIGTISDDGTLHLGNGEEIENKESKLESGLVKFVFKPNEYNTVKVSYNTYKDGGNRTISGEKVGSDINDEDYSSIERDTFTLDYNFNPNSDLINVDLNAYTNEQRMERPESNREYTNKSSGYDLRNSSLIGLHNLTYGTDYTHEEQESEVEGSKILGGKVDNYALYLQDEMIIDRLTLTLGARYDIYELGGIYSGTFNQLSPKMKLKYQLTDKLSLRSGYGRIFKGPALGETLMLSNTSNLSDIQSDNTQPQTGHNFEIGFDYDLSDALEADNSVIGINAYKYNVDNYAHVTKNNALSSQGEVEIWGLETMFSYSKDKLGFNFSHTYTDGEQTNADGIKYDPKTAKIHVFKLGTNYQLTNELKVNYSAQFVPGNNYQTYSGRTSTMNNYERSGYGVHDINFTYKPVAIKDATFNFGVDNIFDKDYVRHSAFGSQTTSTNKSYEIGRNFKFQVSYRF